MNQKLSIPAAVLALSIVPSILFATGASQKDAGNRIVSPVKSQAQQDTVRIDGEKRFRANCGRCHAAPHKFPPRMMTTIVRHMRVRATITDEDMRQILDYMTQ